LKKDKEMATTALPVWRRAVIKIGSGLIAPGGKKCSTQYTLSIAGFITAAKNQGKEIIMVSSGAVAGGLSTQPELLKHTTRTIPEKQALAAIGQPLMMNHWRRFFDFPCAQLLLTYDDVHTRKRFVNAKNTIRQLLRMGCLPIVNENDTVAVEELRVGDNDNLAAYVAMLAEADLLIICSDIDGLYDRDPHCHSSARLLPVVEKIDRTVYALAGGSKNPIATGGMRTKIEAAQKACARGINTVLINGSRREALDSLLAGQLSGTLFKRSQNPMTAKKHWMVHALAPCGQITIDAGAGRALLQGGASLLPSGVTGVAGDFKKGEPVLVLLQQGRQTLPIAKGITRYGARDLTKIKGKKSAEITGILGYIGAEVIHRDDLVLIHE